MNLQLVRRIPDSSKIFFLSNIIFCFALLSSFSSHAQTMKEEAKAAFDYLNAIRQNPPKYSKETGTDLRKVKPRPALIWNDTLARIAEEKALDMGRRNYFAHLNPEEKGINIIIHEAGFELPAEWIKNKESNFFESISAGNETGIEVVRDLILDSYDTGKGHRKHLLGMNEFYSTLTHCGIGHVKVEGSKYTYYTVFIIAKKS